jgi:CRP-like cAMP-binding protein
MAPADVNKEQLKKFARTLSTGEFLFRQDDLGNTLFIIVHGEIELIEHRAGHDYVVGVMGPGQVLGEKAFLTEIPYNRAFSARCKGEASLLEFERKHLPIVETIIPDFAMRILQIAAQRLDRANKVIHILHSFDPIERLVNGLLLLNKESGKQTSEGWQIPTTSVELEQLTNVDSVTIAFFLKELEKKQVIIPSNRGLLITDLNKLTQMMPDLKEILAAA